MNIRRTAAAATTMVAASKIHRRRVERGAVPASCSLTCDPLSGDNGAPRDGEEHRDVLTERGEHREEVKDLVVAEHAR